MKTDYFDPQIKSRPPFRILRKVIGDRVPWRAIIDKSVKLRPNSWIIIERAHANRHLWAVRPFAAEQARATIYTERLYRTLALSINLDQLFALQQAELFLSHTCLRAYSCPGMLAAAIAMTMAGLKERRIHFKAHAAAQTTAANELVHSPPGLVIAMRSYNGAIARAKTFLRARSRFHPLNFAITRRRIRH